MPPLPLDTDLDDYRLRLGSENLMTMLCRRASCRNPPVAATVRPGREWSIDIISTAQRSKLMPLIHSKDTGPGLALRRLRLAAGYGFRLHGTLPESPDLAFIARHEIIFKNSCFWHGLVCHVGQHRPAPDTD